MMKMDPENKSNKVKHFETIENKNINGQSTKGENHARDTSPRLIKTCTKQRNIFVTYKERREITERDMINIMEEYGTSKSLKVYNNIHTNNSKAFICFETKEKAQTAIADINQHPGWKALLYCSRHEIQKNREEGQSDTNDLAKEKNSKKIQTYNQRHEDNNEEIIVIHNIDSKEIEYHVCGLKGHKIKKNVKQNKTSTL